MPWRKERIALPEQPVFPSGPRTAEIPLPREQTMVLTAVPGPALGGELYSMCEHHMLPFFGKCHVAYIPNGKVIGLSKVPRLVDMFSRRLQLQERMTNQIAETIREAIQPLGVAVVCEGTHLCMAMRGVEKQQSTTVTSAMLGAFRSDARTRGEFLQLIKTR